MFAPGTVDVQRGGYAYNRVQSQYVAPPRSIEKQERVLLLLSSITAIIVTLLPIIAIINYPQGVIMEPVLFLEKLYVFLFGLVLLIMEFPRSGHRGFLPVLSEIQRGISRHCKLITKLSGKGLFMIFVGCNCFNVLNPVAQGPFLQSLIVLVGLGTCVIGLIFIFFGIKKWRALNAVRMRLREYTYKGSPILPPLQVSQYEEGLLEHLKQRENLDLFLADFARTNKGSLTKGEFIEITRHVIGMPNFKFSEWDMEMIFDGMHTGGDGAAGAASLEQIGEDIGLHMVQTIQFEEFYDWLRGDYGFMI